MICVAMNNLRVSVMIEDVRQDAIVDPFRKSSGEYLQAYNKYNDG